MKNQNVICQILNYNDTFHVKKLVSKIKDFSVFNYILIVDNASTDGSFEKLSDLYKDDDHIKVIVSNKNGGYGYGNNFGIKYASAKLNASMAIVCNPDVEFTESTVINLVKLMKKTDAAITSGVEINKVPSINKAWKIPTPLQWILDETKLRKLSFKKYHYPDENIQKKYSQEESVSGAFYKLNRSNSLDHVGDD